MKIQIKFLTFLVLLTINLLLNSAAECSSNNFSEKNHMLQYKAGNHVLGFDSNKIYLAAMDHALTIEFMDSRNAFPKEMKGSSTQKNRAGKFNKVVYQDLWYGINLTYLATEHENADVIYHIEPGASVEKIKLKYNVPIEVQKDNSLVLKFASGNLTEAPPLAWQEINGKKVPVEVSYKISGNIVGFEAGLYDKTQPIIIRIPDWIPIFLRLTKPAYSWHTFYGGWWNDSGKCIAVDDNGNVYIAGDAAKHWPNDPPPGATEDDIVIVKLDSNGSYQWHKFFGGTGYEHVYGIAVDKSGNIYVTGDSSRDWGLNNGASTPKNPFVSNADYSIFVLKVNASGMYQWHSFWGGVETNYGFGIAVDNNGGVYIAGQTVFPWNGPGNRAPLHPSSSNTEQQQDIAVIKLNSSGVYQWHTFYGSTSTEWVYGIAADSNGDIYVTGFSSNSWNGPVNEMPKHGFTGSGDSDIFVLKLNSSGSYLWHTFYGSNRVDRSYGIAVGPNNNVYITGITRGTTWLGPSGEQPRNSQIDPAHNPIMVVALKSNGEYLWHTFLGNADDVLEHENMGIIVDSGGNVFVAGYTSYSWLGPGGKAPDFPFHAWENMFLLKLNNLGDYVWHSFYGSSKNGEERAYGLAKDNHDNIYVTGLSYYDWRVKSFQRPIHAYNEGLFYPDGSQHEGQELFVMKLYNLVEGQ